MQIARFAFVDIDTDTNTEGSKRFDSAVWEKYHVNGQVQTGCNDANCDLCFVLLSRPESITEILSYIYFYPPQDADYNKVEVKCSLKCS